MRRLLPCRHTATRAPPGHHQHSTFPSQANPLLRATALAECFQAPVPRERRASGTPWHAAPYRMSVSTSRARSQHGVHRPPEPPCTTVEQCSDLTTAAANKHYTSEGSALGYQQPALFSLHPLHVPSRQIRTATLPATPHTPQSIASTPIHTDTPPSRFQGHVYCTALYRCQ